MNSIKSIKTLIMQNCYKVSREQYDKSFSEYIDAAENISVDRSEAASSFKPIKYIKLATVVVIALTIICLHQFNNMITGTGIVWADVAKRMEEVNSYKARSKRIFTEADNGKSVIECEVLSYFSPEYGYVEEQYIDGQLGMIVYASFKDKLFLLVIPPYKQYYRFELNEEIISVLEFMNPANINGIIKLFGSERCKKLGTKDIDGVTAEGFEVEDIKVFTNVPKILFQLKDMDMRLWVDPETLLPIRTEAEGMIEKGILTGFKNFHGKNIAYDIEYDVLIDNTVFDPNVPDGYILINPAGISLKAEFLMVGILPFFWISGIYKIIKRSLRKTSK